MFKFLQRNKIAPITLMPGDSIAVYYTEPNKETELLSITQVTEENAGTYDEAFVLQADKELGYSKALLGGVGKK